VSSEADQEVLKAIEKRFEVALPLVHPHIDIRVLANGMTVNSLRAALMLARTWPAKGKISGNAFVLVFLSFLKVFRWFTFACASANPFPSEAF
jgi:hypothetical protein